MVEQPLKDNLQAVKNTCKILPERKNRGKRYYWYDLNRMEELLKRAKKEGNKFWKELGVDYDSADDDDYVESDIEEDIVDSDFDLSPTKEDNKKKRRQRSTTRKKNASKKITNDKVKRKKVQDSKKN